MSECTFIFPHQLFADHPGLAKNRPAYLIEDQLFFKDWHYPARFHKIKLFYHIVSMAGYMRTLLDKGYDVQLIRYEKGKDLPSLSSIVKAKKVKEVHFADPVDFMLQQRLQKWCQKQKIQLVMHDSPGFLLTREEAENAIDLTSANLNQTAFYRSQRKAFAILMDKDKPVGGKWTYDTDNRQKMPHTVHPPEWSPQRMPKGYKTTIADIDDLFSSHPGTIGKLYFPYTQGQAKEHLKKFLKQSFNLFGDYQDALSKDHPFVFHSLLSPAINVGLISPRELLDQVISYAEKHKVHLNSLEGFVRQVLGWREFMRVVYCTHGVKQRTSNFWKHTNSMPKALYNGTTGILPVDHVITKVLETGYAHHIERLMVLGNFMLLCEIHPDEVYTWFMELFIDAYDWVMVPNVYSMSQYAAGGLMTTKPYISSSNYLRKMSDYPKGTWCDIWDGLYWRFIAKHEKFFSSNPRLSLMTSLLKRMDKQTLKAHEQTADSFLKQLFS